MWAVAYSCREVPCALGGLEKFSRHSNVQPYYSGCSTRYKARLVACCLSVSVCLSSFCAWLYPYVSLFVSLSLCLSSFCAWLALSLLVVSLRTSVSLILLSNPGCKSLHAALLSLFFLCLAGSLLVSLRAPVSLCISSFCAWLVYYVSLFVCLSLSVLIATGISGGWLTK